MSHEHHEGDESLYVHFVASDWEDDHVGYHFDGLGLNSMGIDCKLEALEISDCCLVLENIQFDPVLVHAVHHDVNVHFHGAFHVQSHLVDHQPNVTHYRLYVNLLHDLAILNHLDFVVRESGVLADHNANRVDRDDCPNDHDDTRGHFYFRV